MVCTQSLSLIGNKDKMQPLPSYMVRSTDVRFSSTPPWPSQFQNLEKFWHSTSEQIATVCTKDNYFD